MSTKKYLSLERLTEYDTLIKSKIDADNASVKSYVDTEVAKKADSSHTHDDRYYTETEIDEKINSIPNYVVRNLEDVTKIVEKSTLTGFYFYLNDPIPNGLYYFDVDKHNGKILTAVIVNKEGTAVDKQFSLFYPYLLKISSDEESVVIDCFYTGGTTQFYYDIANKTYISTSTSYGANEIDEIISDLNTYITEQLALKAESNHTHDDRYYTETEIDGKLSAVNTSIVNITSGSTPVKEAEHATSADSATNANHATSADNATIATSATKATQDGNGKVIADTYETKTDASAKLTEAKSYADSAASKVKDDLLNGAGAAYDTLKELGELIDDNKDAIDALEDIASGKADATHSHAIADVSGLQSELDGKAASSHGDHVTFDSTNKPKMDGTAAFGASTKVARADHVHPTDTSRASKTSLDSHIGDTDKHVSSTERTNWGSAYTHSTSAHAPSSAQENVIESIKVNGTAQTIKNKSVNITVPTKASDVGAAESTHGHEISDIINLQTTLNNAANGIQANTNSINAHTDRISALETKVGDGFEEITSNEIIALFN